ncbi:class I SAM-dependent methyltransferase [Sporomusa sp.]|uniref:tRNA (mnm(5)s(2)U34)-methyltransferase n=1 Tax=Sporomusa sp. TaxID=2078658 RepID=UPI002C33590D|nr:class I SAM-dependent methyltransferase [Sporomusa sp.]HWR45221.1 class I SAM-dependent methyltransferase [Sporomusa sp.]
MEVANAVVMAQRLLRPKLVTAILVVDATAGNGNDTLFLADNTPNTTVVWAFDIQTQALTKTQELLTNHELDYKVHLVLDSHAHIPKYINQPVDAAMFNLGYLPGGDHAISTSSDTTIQAIAQTLQLLAADGLVTIAAYPGYEHGRLELQAVHEYLTSLSQKMFTVACWSMVNQKNSPPVLYVIEKIRSEQLEGSTSLKD